MPFVFNMSKRLTQEDFIRRAREVHGDKYDYSKATYINNRAKVCVICPIHGEFWQTAYSHLNKNGCPKCGVPRRKSLVQGVGVNDLEIALRTEGKKAPFYTHWGGMLKRCYNESFHNSYPTYKECSVCKDWLILSKFKTWFDKYYVEGWHLDKDILVKGNKVYSPETCCFVPREINFLILRKQNHRGTCPIGVHLSSNKKKYKAFVTKESEKVFLGRYNSKEEAFCAYKEAKEAQIKEVANKYKDQLEPRVYEALMNYKIEITD